MSRLGKKPLQIPAGVEATYSEGTFSVKGPKGALSKEFNDLFVIDIENNEVTMTPQRKDKKTLALWGTYASHVTNMFTGVTDQFTKKLIVEGVGYKANVQGNKLVLDLGFSHQIEMIIPEGLAVEVQKDTVSITGVNKETVGQFAANVRKHRKPEPYKGKGIRYDDEVVRRKQGKKAV
jgi:large subunit ribosomal protein L6